MKPTVQSYSLVAYEAQILGTHVSLKLTKRGHGTLYKAFHYYGRSAKSLDGFDTPYRVFRHLTGCDMAVRSSSDMADLNKTKNNNNNIETHNPTSRA